MWTKSSLLTIFKFWISLAFAQSNKTAVFFHQCSCRYIAEAPCISIVMPICCTALSACVYLVLRETIHLGSPSHVALTFAYPLEKKTEPATCITVTARSERSLRVSNAALNYRLSRKRTCTASFYVWLLSVDSCCLWIGNSSNIRWLKLHHQGVTSFSSGKQ